MANDTKVIWKPQAGSQALFLSCPHFEVLYEGTRGPGKTDALIMDFAQHVGQGFGQHWRGVLFRRTYKQLDDVVAKTYKWFPRIFPDAKYNKNDFTWTFGSGEQLLLRHFDGPRDYWNYHGHEFPWFGWEELTNWPDLGGYEDVMTCCRSSHPGMPRKYRSTANPYGVGHNPVKRRFVDPMPVGVPIEDDQGRKRVRVHGTIWENRILLDNDPEYIKNLQAQSDPNKRKAWLEGSWDITSGGMFDDLWNADQHVVKPFKIPANWYIDRSFDHGTAKPFSVLWWAEANGEDVETEDGRTIRVPAGTLFCISEWYGSVSLDQPNKGIGLPAPKISEGIIDRETAMVRSGLIQSMPRPGGADSAIYSVIDEESVADRMEEAGIRWLMAPKGPGSRIRGWEAVRGRLSAAIASPVEERALFIFESCRNLIQNLPSLPRSDRNIEDADTEAPDHDADSLRYRLATKRHSVGTAAAPW